MRGMPHFFLQWLSCAFVSARFVSTHHQTMPYFATSQDWLKQSSLLLRARPTTVRPNLALRLLGLTRMQTRITTKYKLAKPKAPKAKTSEAAGTSETTSSAPSDITSRATLTLKTYDPVSGVCLKYRTEKAAEVGRLVAILGRLGKDMAGLPETDDATMEDVKEETVDSTQEGTTVPQVAEKPVTAGKEVAGASKKKKKGKR